MNREKVAAQIRKDTASLVKMADAHIAVGMVLGSEGGVSECSHVMDPANAAYFMRTVTEAARGALALINGGELFTHPMKHLRMHPEEHCPAWAEGDAVLIIGKTYQDNERGDTFRPCPCCWPTSNGK